MSVRVKVNEEDLSKIQEDLKEKGYTLDNISEQIDSEFRNFLYKGHSMRPETFDKLRNIYPGEIDGKRIEYIDGKGEKKDIKLPKDAKTAEFIGIMLGDGYLQQTKINEEGKTVSSYRLVITLHEEEDALKRKVLELISGIVGEKPYLHRLKSSNAVQIILHSSELIEELVGLGLEPGDKVENQVSIPVWIKENPELQKACLRGLIDTDGTIYRQETDGRAVIQFKNHSEPLLRGFEQLCDNLGIETSSGGQNTVQVSRQNEVKKTIELVRPLKSSNISF